jgi:hypothetical protein
MSEDGRPVTSREIYEEAVRAYNRAVKDWQAAVAVVRHASAELDAAEVEMCEREAKLASHMTSGRGGGPRLPRYLAEPDPDGPPF